MRYLLPYFFLLTLFAMGCGTRNTSTTGGASTSTSSRAAASKVVRNVEKNAFKTQYLEGSARIKLESEKLNIGGTATIRLERDKAIWVSVKKFGFEGARALIRPDSFFLYNRLSGDNLAEPLSYVERKYNVPARFDLLQEIILGNAVFLTRDLEVATQDGLFELAGSDSKYTTNYLVEDGSYHVKRMRLTENGTDRVVEIVNSDFKPVAGGQGAFAHERVVSIDSKDSGPAMVELDYSKVRLEGPLEMPFRRR